MPNMTYHTYHAKRLFITQWTHTLYSLLKHVNGVAILLTLVFSWLALLAASTQTPNSTWAGLTQATWSSVAASMLAAALFLCIQSFLDAVKKTEVTLESKYYHEMNNEHGVKGAYKQRGSSDIVKEYEHLIKKARHRIWAFGMTNRNFINQHRDIIIGRIQSQDVNVVIGFWDPGASICIGQSHESLSMIETQLRLEYTATSGSLLAEDIQNRYKTLIDKIDTLPSRSGQLRIVYLTVPTNISCLIVDDDLFFFPFVAGSDSTREPTIYCDSNIGIGACLVSHFEKLLANGFAARTIETRGPTANKERIER